MGFDAQCMRRLGALETVNGELAEVMLVGPSPATIDWVCARWELVRLPEPETANGEE